MGLETAAIIAAVAAAVPALVGVGKMIFPPEGAGSGDVTAAGAKKMADMQKAASAYGAYRPDQADARMKAMAQQLSAYKGAGNIMQSMYGGTGGGGTYTPGQGGYKGPNPDSFAGGYKPPTWLPPKGDTGFEGTPWKTQAEYDAYVKWQQEQARIKTGNIGTGGAGNQSPPIYVPPTTGGIGAGSSGTSFTGPLPPPDQSLTPMALMLARNRTV